MVDLMTGSGTKEESNGEHIKRIMDRTQGIFKSRMLSFLGNSSDIINDLSNKLESALSLGDSTSYSTDEVLSGFDSSHPSTKEDDEAPVDKITTSTPRKLHTLPTLGLSYEDREALAKHKHKHQPTFEDAIKIKEAITADRSEDSISTSVAVVVETKSKNSSRCDELTDMDRDLSSVHLSQSVESHLEHCLVATGPDPYDKLKVKQEVPSSGSASDLDGYGPSTSMDSSDKDGKKYWVRSGSEGSVQSWASSLSLDSQSDEASVEFMRHFVAQLFVDSTTIPLDQKSKFGQLCQNETGRLWFSRFVNAQRGRSKKVNESTFLALIQYFATVLFECSEADDFSPAKSLMNMCFTFYWEVDVPGCEPYKEYLYIYLRDQPIWHSIRFWNAAFFDALQCERIHNPVATKDDIQSNNLEAFFDEKRYQENITFGQLGTFTYNMHAFGLSRELCSEFLRKQCVIANLSKEQETMLKDNVDRMYKATDPWRTQ